MYVFALSQKLEPVKIDYEDCGVGHGEELKKNHQAFELEYFGDDQGTAEVAGEPD